MLVVNIWSSWDNIYCKLMDVIMNDFNIASGGSIDENLDGDLTLKNRGHGRMQAVKLLALYQVQLPQ